MTKYVVWFEDTTNNPERAYSGTPSLGLPIEHLPENLNIFEKQFYDNACMSLSGVLVDGEAVIKLREMAEKVGTGAWIRDYSEHSYKTAWQAKKTIDGRHAFTPDNNDAK